MEREDCFAKKEISIKREGVWQKKEISVPAANYQCPSCGSCYLWVKGEKLQEISVAFGGRDVVDYLSMDKQS